VRRFHHNESFTGESILQIFSKFSSYSTTKEDGAGHATVVEYPVIAKRVFSVQWKREVFSLSQKTLATLRARHGWTNKELAEHCGVSLSTIKVYLYAIDRSLKTRKQRESRD
jgi:DNA-binding NarL/FixJ family response regulator